MNKRKLIEKTIRKQRGYTYSNYRTEYNDKEITIYHYRTPIFYFYIDKEKQYDNNLHFKLGSGWSRSDMNTISLCLSVIGSNWNDYTIFGSGCNYTERKWFRIHYKPVDDNGSIMIATKRDHNQFTLYNYNPWKRKIMVDRIVDGNSLEKLKTYDYGKRRRRGIGRNLIWKGTQLKLIE